MRRPLSLLLVAGLALSACTSTQRARISPRCDFDNGSVLLLMAQSVPTAQLIPCIEALPIGWEFRTVHVREGEARFLLDSDRFGNAFLEVGLTPACDHDFVGQPYLVRGGFTRRSIEVQAARGQYLGNWYFSFDGGCVTYRFAALGQEIPFIHTETEEALSFVTRGAVDRFVRDAVDIPLDP